MHIEPMLDSYNENSALQATCQTIGNPILAAMASAYSAERPTKSVRIVEYGCAGARNSHDPMNAALSALRARHPALRAECVFNDLPSNAWSQVVEEGQKLSKPYGGDIQILCAPTSFYESVCADDSVDLAYSYAALQFVSEYRPLTSHVIMHEAAPDERRAWEAVAAQDWNLFLTQRARELKPGAKMLICTMHRDASGYSWQQIALLLWDCMQRACAKGTLSNAELSGLAIRGCLRSEDEILAPFAKGSAASTWFTVDSLHFARTELEGEKRLPPHQLAPLIRKRVESVYGGMFLSQLARMGRTAASASATMQEIWNLFEAGISQDPSRAWQDMRAFYLTLTRK